MRITLNGAEFEVDERATITTLMGDARRGSAVVVDGEVVPRAVWPDYRLRAGQQVELITAVPGG